MFPTPIGLYLLFLATTNVFGTQVPDVQGPAFKSSLVGQTIHNLTGIVTAKVGFPHLCAVKPPHLPFLDRAPTGFGSLVHL